MKEQIGQAEAQASQLWLASRSPRRRELLAQIGLRFGVVDVDVEEIPGAGESAQAYARRIARDKVRAGAAAVSDALPVLASDTDVVLDGEILGKPRDRAHGIELLRRLSGRRHQVISSVAVLAGGALHEVVVESEVCFGPVSEPAAAAYWASGEPLGKAGGYAIQGLGAVFVREIRGSYSGIVGLPVYETAELLSRAGIEVLPVGVPA